MRLYLFYYFQRKTCSFGGESALHLSHAIAMKCECFCFIKRLEITYITNVRPSLNGNNISKWCRHVMFISCQVIFNFQIKEFHEFQWQFHGHLIVNTTDNSAEDTFHITAMYIVIIKVWQKQKQNKIYDTIDCHCSSNRYSKYTKTMRTNPTWTVRYGNLSVLCKTISQQYD